MVIPFWLKIVGPLVLFAVIIGSIKIYGNSRYNAGVRDTDDKWELASAKLKADAAKSATKADDAAATRLEQYVEQATEDQEKVDAANRDGTSPLDALFR